MMERYLLKDTKQGNFLALCFQMNCERLSDEQSIALMEDIIADVEILKGLN